MSDSEYLKTGCVTDGQKMFMVSFMESHPGLVQNEMVGMSCKEDLRRRWEELAASLNLLSGSHKSVEKWQQCWKDQWKIVKKKASQIANYERETGGGRSVKQLDSYEERVLKVCGGWPRISGWKGSIDPLEDLVVTDTLQGMKSPLHTLVTLQIGETLKITSIMSLHHTTEDSRAALDSVGDPDLDLLIDRLCGKASNLLISTHLDQ
ncbi:Putrescine hydroxycinnamoyltransferase 1 [Frankliniella fusca]|uniref:Regulatory protein zeste n=1 Tax=Frankliniella fusca TaxID=407009 RepID=A0AAE1LTB4_9NEOP|nr:Putrescine hydroxycinnamoyltransferase 1 [Frankliniella fusca]